MAVAGLRCEACREGRLPGRRRTRSRCGFTVVFAATVVLGATGVGGQRYPQDALKCVSSLTAPEGLLICPEFRNTYCVKEVTTLSETDCGRTSYFGDEWNTATSKCEYRKCEAACAESSWDFEFEGETYERNRFCCDYDYCNGASMARPSRALAAVTTTLLGIALALGGHVRRGS